MAGFLDGTHPVADTHETKLRLEHMLRRLRLLESAHQTERPSRILEHLYLGSALSAQSRHTLKRCGITDVINATTVTETPFH